MKRKIKLFIAIVIALGVWQAVAMKINETIIIASPIDVCKRLLSLVKEKGFLSVTFFSFGRIIKGFLIGFFLGVFLAVIGGKWENAEILFKPFMSAIRSVPVASFVVLSLFWFGTEKLSVFISFLMVLPIIYTNVLQGIKSIDEKMTQMAKVFKMPFFRRVKFLWLPSVKPFLISGSTVASGLAWKSGIAAEIIGVPTGSIGEALYESKIYLDTETLLAWTVMIVFLSIGTEKLFSLAIKGIFRLFEITVLPEKSAKKEKISPLAVEMTDVKKSYGDQTVLDGFSGKFDVGVTALVGRSGSGKTTLLNMLLKLEKQDFGEISGGDQKLSAVFQEDRLCEGFTPAANIFAVTGSEVGREEIEGMLCEMGLNDSLHKKVSQLSGGMKRRVAICRALCSDSELLVMDEPFKGLDDETKISVIKTVKKYICDKTVVFVTHDEEEAVLLGAEKVIRLVEN